MNDKERGRMKGKGGIWTNNTLRKGLNEHNAFSVLNNEYISKEFSKRESMRESKEEKKNKEERKRKLKRPLIVERKQEISGDEVEDQQKAGIYNKILIPQLERKERPVSEREYIEVPYPCIGGYKIYKITPNHNHYENEIYPGRYPYAHFNYSLKTFRTHGLLRYSGKPAKQNKPYYYKLPREYSPLDDYRVKGRQKEQRLAMKAEVEFWKDHRL